MSKRLSTARPSPGWRPMPLASARVSWRELARLCPRSQPGERACPIVALVRASYVGRVVIGTAWTSRHPISTQPTRKTWALIARPGGACCVAIQPVSSTIGSPAGRLDLWQAASYIRIGKFCGMLACIDKGAGWRETYPPSACQRSPTLTVAAPGHSLARL
jgi:hypothetical protein